MKLTKKSRRLSRLNSRIFFILLITIAAILAWLSTQYNYQADWTSSGRHTLSEASQTLLSRLDGPVNITAYARDDKRLRKRITRLIERYQRIKPDITLNYINPDVVPDKIRELGISVNGELVIHYGDRSEHVQSHSEDNLTNALHRLVRGEQRWLAFIEGHGERKPFGHANHDLSDWVRQLTKRGLKVHPLKLATIASISDNTAVLVIAGPEVDLLPGEVAMIVDYVDGGGNVLWLADPGSTHGLTPLAEQLGVAFQPGTIVHPTTELYGIEHPTIILVTTYGLHPAIQDFPYLSVFPKTVGIELNAPDGWHGEALLADVGAGTGLFVPLFSEAVGPAGTVYAVDIVPAFIEHMRTNAARQGLGNVRAVLCTERSVELEPGSIDLAFICDAYHHFEYPRSTMSSIHRALRTGGELVLIDFERIPGDSSAWVIDHVRAGKERVRSEIEGMGFELVEEVDLLESNYVLRFRTR